MSSIIVTAILLIIASAFPASGGTLTGMITDSEGRPQRDVEVYVYRNGSTRRPADFISSRSGDDGIYRLNLPAGEYWIVARERRDGDERFGPLPVDRRHSGEPVTISIDHEESVVTRDFVIYLLQEAAVLKRWERTYLSTISARIVNRSGQPVSGAYLFAINPGSTRSFPDYFSPSSDGDGFARISLPPGRYEIGATTTFPPAPPVRGSLTVSTDGTEPVVISLE